MSQCWQFYSMAETGESSLSMSTVPSDTTSLPDTVAEQKSDPGMTVEPGREILCSVITDGNTISTTERSNDPEKERSLQEQSIHENQQQTEMPDQNDQVIESTMRSLTQSLNVQEDKSSDGEVLMSNRDASGLVTSTVVPQVNADCQPMDISDQEACANKSQVASIPVSPPAYEDGKSDAGVTMNDGHIQTPEKELSTQSEQNYMSDKNVQETEGKLSQPSQVPHIHEENVQVMEDEMDSARSAPQSSEGNIQTTESDISLASPVPQVNEKNVQVTQSEMNSASQVPESNEANVQATESEMTETVQALETEMVSASQDLQNNSVEIVQATESEMAQASKVPQSNENILEVAEGEMNSATPVHQSTEGNVQATESEMNSATPVHQSTEGNVQATESDVSSASQVVCDNENTQSEMNSANKVPRNEKNALLAEGEMDSASQVCQSNEENIPATESKVPGDSATPVPQSNVEHVQATESEMTSATPVPQSHVESVQATESEMTSATPVPQSNEGTAQTTETPSLTQSPRISEKGDGGGVDQVAVSNGAVSHHESNEAEQLMNTECGTSDHTVQRTDGDTQSTGPNPQATEKEVPNGTELLMSNKDICTSEPSAMEVQPNTNDQQPDVPDLSAQDSVPNSASPTEPQLTTESLQTNATDQDNQETDSRMASPSPAPPRVLSATELIMSYRDLSSSATSSSSDSSSSDGLLTDSSSDEEAPSKPGPVKVNGQRPPRRGSRDGSGVAKTKGELQVEDLPPLEDLHIEVDDSVILHEVGNVSSVVGLLVIVKGQREVPALNADTILFSKDRKVLGQVFEIFGPVASPFYSVRFNTSQQIEERGIKVGFPVFFAPRVQEFTHYVFLEQLRQLKGSDASWEHNNEPPAQYLDYSDDEEERRARARARGRDVSTGENGEQQPGKKRRNRNQRKNRKPGQQDEHRKENDSQMPTNIQTWPPEAGGQRNFQGSHRPAYRPPANNPFSQVGANRFHHGPRSHRPQGRGGQPHHSQYQPRPGPPVDGSRNQPPYMMRPPAPGPASNGYYYGFPGSYPQRPPMGSMPYPPQHDHCPPRPQSQSQSPAPGVSGPPGGGVSYMTGASPTVSQPQCPTSSSASSSGYAPYGQNTGTHPPGTDCPPPHPPVAPGCPPASAPAATPPFSVPPPPSHAISPPGVSNSRPLVDMRYMQNAGPNTGPNTTPSASNWQPPQPPYFGRYPPPPAEFGGYPSFQSGPQMGWRPPR